MRSFFFFYLLLLPSVSCYVFPQKNIIKPLKEKYLLSNTERVDFTIYDEKMSLSLPNGIPIIQKNKSMYVNFIYFFKYFFHNIIIERISHRVYHDEIYIQWNLFCFLSFLSKYKVNENGDIYNHIVEITFPTNELLFYPPIMRPIRI